MQRRLQFVVVLAEDEIVAALDAGYTQAPDTGGPNRHSTWLATIDGETCAAWATRNRR